MPAGDRSLLRAVGHRTRTATAAWQRKAPWRAGSDRWSDRGPALRRRTIGAGSGCCLGDQRTWHQSQQPRDDVVEPPWCQRRSSDKGGGGTEHPSLSLHVEVAELRAGCWSLAGCSRRTARRAVAAPSPSGLVGFGGEPYKGAREAGGRLLPVTCWSQGNSTRPSWGCCGLY